MNSTNTKIPPPLHHTDNATVVEVEVPISGRVDLDQPNFPSSNGNESVEASQSDGDTIARLDRPLRLVSIRVNGADHARNGFLQRICDRHFGLAGSASRLSDVMEITRRINAELEAHDLYRNEYTRSTLVRSTSFNANATDVDLVLDVVEKGRLWLKTSTDVGSNEGTATVSGRLRNVFGGAESAELNYSYGTATKAAYNAVLSTPLQSLPTTRLSLITTRSSKLLPQAAVDASVDAAIVAISHSALGAFKAGAHRLALSLESRNLIPKPGSSASIRNEVQENGNKLSLTHSYDLDSRDDNVVPTTGRHWRSFLEAAHYQRGGQSLKGTFAGTFSRPLTNFCNISWHTGFQSGIFMQSQDCKSTILDRLSGGGPSSVRMFSTNSLGPRRGADWVGGNLSWGLGAGLIGTLPNWKPSTGLFWHVFVNGGQLQKQIPGRIADIVAPSASVGFGLIYRMNPVRLELNIGLPLSASPTDGIKRGFQLGLGSEFL